MPKKNNRLCLIKKAKLLNSTSIIYLLILAFLGITANSRFAFAEVIDGKTKLVVDS